MNDAINPLESHDPDVNSPAEFDIITKPRHYVENYGIEPMEFVMNSWMARAVATWEAMNYLARHPFKEANKLQDLKKARQWLDRLIAYEEIEAAKNKQAADMVTMLAGGKSI